MNYDIITSSIYIYNQDKDTIVPDTLYDVWIISDNAFEGNSFAVGNPTTLRTLGEILIHNSIDIYKVYLNLKQYQIC